MKSSTTIEGMRFYSFYAVRDIDRRHTITIVERIRTDIIDSRGQHHCTESLTAIESVFANSFNRSINRKRFHRVTIVESVIANI